MSNRTNSLEEFLAVLREYELKTFSKFVCMKSEKGFTEEKFTPSVKKKLLWWGDMPRYSIGRRWYACHQGRDSNQYQKKRYAKKRDSMDQECTKRRILTQPTKKLGCPVVIQVSRFLAFPSFKVSKLAKYEKYKMSEVIRNKIEMGEDLGGEYVYSFNLPDETSHQNHTVGSDAAVKEIVDPIVRSKIKELVYQGERDISTITALMEHYVANELGETDKSRSRFYPNRVCMRNIIYTVKREIGVDTRRVRKNPEKRSKNGTKKLSRVGTKKRLKDGKENSEDLSDIFFQQDNSEICTQQDESEVDCEENQTLRKKHELISDCNSTIRSLQSSMWLLGEQYLEKLRNELLLLHQEATLHLAVGQDTVLTIATSNS